MSPRSWRGFAVAAAAAAAALVGPFVATATASHGRYLNVAWKVAPSDPNTVDFIVSANFRRSEYAGDCVPNPCSGSDGYPLAGDVVAEDISGTELFFGDGQTTEELQFVVTAANVAEDWIHVAALEPERPEGKIDTLIRHTYTGPGPWRAEVDTCCTPAGLRNNAENDFRAATLVDLALDEESALSTIAPVVEVGLGGFQRWRVSAADVGGERLRFRLATAEESCASQCDDPQPPGLAIGHETGEVLWNTTGLGQGVWQTSVVIESLSAGGAVLSSSQVTYLISVRPGAPSGPGAGPAPAPRAPQAACRLSVSRTRIPAAVPTTVRVRAFRVDGTAAAGVTVTLTGTRGIRRQTRVTNAQGFATFTVVARQGNARIRVSSSGGCGVRTLQARRSADCSGVATRPGSMRVGVARVVSIRIRIAGRAVAGTLVRASGAGVSAAGRTDRRGFVRLRIRPTRAGFIRITAPNVLSCSRAIGVRSGDVPFTG
jgi:hypothetical protein